MLYFGNDLLGKHPKEYIPSLLGFLIGEEAKRGTVFSKAMIEGLFFVPSVS